MELNLRVQRISERPAAKVEGHRLFEGEADGGEVSNARTHLDVGEGRPQRLSITEDMKKGQVTKQNSHQQRNQD